MIAMFTSTSPRFSSLFPKNSSTFDTPLSSICFLSSAISIISHSLITKSPMLSRDKRSSKRCGAEVQFTAFRLLSILTACSRPESRFLLSLTAGVTYHLRVLKCLETGKAQKEVGVSVWVSVMDLLREERVNHTIYSPLFLCEIVEIRTIRSNYRHFGCHGDHNYF